MRPPVAAHGPDGSIPSLAARPLTSQVTSGSSERWATRLGHEHRRRVMCRPADPSNRSGQSCQSRTRVSVSEPLVRRPASRKRGSRSAIRSSAGRARVSEPSPWSRASCTVLPGRTVGREHRPNSRAVQVHSAATRGSPHIAVPSHISLACRAHQSECGRTPPTRGRHHKEDPSP